MNIEEARKRIQEAKEKNLKRLHLGAFLADGLSSIDLEFLLPEIKEIKGLTWLYLDHNSLTDLSFIKELPEISELYLRFNKIADISPLKNLKNLQSLHLFGNHLLEQKLGNVINNSLNPKAIIREYIDWDDAKKNKTLVSLNEAKIILIGQGNVGKSSLRVSLKEGKCSERLKKTEGLEIVEWDLVVSATRTIKFNIWDFGGQEIYHTTHQYFFSSECLYLLVVDFSGRVEWRTNRLGYWLKTIQMLAKEEHSNTKPVVVIVGNKADDQGAYKMSQEVIENELDKARGKFKDLDIVGFVPISCHKGENIHLPVESNKTSLIDTIKEQLSKIGVDREIAQKYVDYKNAIIESGKDCIEVKEFEEFCPRNTELMRIVFHSIGIITSFCDNPKIKSERLRNLIVFNCEWITKGIYKILSASHVLETNNGIATREELRGLLDENKYPSLDDIIEMMKEFYICRSKWVDDINGKQVEKFFFPKFYSNKTPAWVQGFKVNAQETQNIFRYDYSFISDNIIPFFIIKAEDKFKVTNFWKDGGYIVEDELQALIEADEEDNSITITTKRDYSESLLNRIRSIFAEIHKMDFIPNPKNEGVVLSNSQNTLQYEILNLKLENATLKKQITNMPNSKEYNIEQHFHGGNPNIPIGDNATANQYNYLENEEVEKKVNSSINNFEEKLETIISKQEESKASQEQSLGDLTNDIQNMLNELVSVIGLCFDKLDSNEQKRFEELKRKDDWESTLTLTIPLLDKLGIKIESKTKLENLKQKAKDQIELVKARLKSNISQITSLETNEQKDQLES